MKRFIALFRKHPLLTVGFVLASLAGLLLAMRLVFSVVYWTAHANLPPQPDMPLGYIARSHNVPVQDLREAAGLAGETRDRRTIAEIAAAEGISADELLARVNAALARLKADGQKRS
ncbi:MAG: hypothetical protein H6883_06700 [Rhodobiaceae bacterium]|nr:hypothetical protein [Rhodobiaceae bacterium]MCC0055808.1 hypothetical protein [Rhodobiaceae bacterium]